MTTFQLVGCHLALRSDMGNVVVRDEFTPFTFPELLIIKHMHGDEAVTNVVVVGEVEREMDEERARLFDHYGIAAREVFPHAHIPLPLEDPGMAARAAKAAEAAAAAAAKAAEMAKAQVAKRSKSKATEA